MTFHRSRNSRQPIRGRRRPRRGVILLFVVVLLTLLAIVGSAFLISTRIDASQIGPEARGKELDIFGTEAREQLDDVRARTVRAAQLALFLDLFESRRQAVATGGSAERPWPQNNLIWRPSRSTADANLPRTAGTAPAPNPDLTVPPGMADFANLAYYAGETGGATGTQFLNAPADDAVHDNSNSPAYTTELLTRRFPFYPVDALGYTDPHLAAPRVEWEPNLQDPRLPAAQIGEYVWRWVSGPLIGLPSMPVDNLFVNPFGDSDVAPAAIRGSFVDTTRGRPFGGHVAADLNFNANARANVVPTLYRPYTTGDFGTAGETAVVEYVAGSDVQAYAGTSDEWYNDRARSYPGFEIDADGDGTLDYKFPAADADGDGVADSGLVPVVFNTSFLPDEPNRYYDPATGYAYTISTRIVDNNAFVNINTALAVSADYKLFDATGTDVPFVPVNANWETAFVTGGAQRVPNFGYWASNVGMFELFPVRTGRITATNYGATAGQTFNSLVSTLLGNSNTNPANALTITDAVLPTQFLRADATVTTLGESLNFGVATQLVEGSPVAVGTDAGAPVEPQPFLGDDVATALRYQGGGWLVPGTDQTRLDRAARDALVIGASNFTPRDDQIFGDFPLYDPDATDANLRLRRILWAKMFQTADPDFDTVAPFDEPGFGTSYTFDSATLVGGGGTPRYPISPRAGLVARNGVSGAFAPNMINPQAAALSLDLASLPTGMSPYAGTNASVRPPVQAGLNTAGFGELYRAAWNTMVARAGVGSPNDTPLAPVVPTTQNPDLDTFTFTAPAPSGGAAGTDDEFSADELVLAGATDLTREQVLLLRAAIWAVNAMDVRDIERTNTTTGLADPGDSDITVAEVPLSYVRDPSVGYQPNPGTAGFNEYLPYDTNDPNGDGSAWVGATAPVAKQLAARVYGTEAQPYISEVVAQWEAGAGPTAPLEYLAVELVNPYPYDLQMRGWRLVARDVNTGALTNLAVLGEVGVDRNGNGVLTDAQVFPSAMTDPANTPADPTDDVYAPHRFVLEFGTRPATIMPEATGPTTTNTAELADGNPAGTNGSVREGLTAFTPANISNFDSNDHVLMLVRPAVNNAAAAPAPGDPNYYLSPRADYNLVPLDAVDFRGIEPLPSRRIHYARDDADRTWQVVFSGDYVEGNAATLDTVAVSTGVLVDPNPTGPTLGDTGLGAATPAGSATVDAGTAGVTATGGFPVGPVLSGPIYEAGSGVPVFPYGGFARAGDAMGVPFVGSYALFLDGAVLAPGQVQNTQPANAQPDSIRNDIEVLAFFPVTVDTAFADADANDFWGRFIAVTADGTAAVHAWADDALDYVTAIANFGDDTFPNADVRYTGVDLSLNASGVLPAALYTAYQTDPGRLFTADSGVFQVPPVDNDGNGLFGLVLPSDFAVAGYASAAEAQAERMREAFLPAQGRLNVLTSDAGILKLAPLDVTAGGFNDEAVTSTTAVAMAEANNPTPAGAVTFRQPYNASAGLNAITGLSAFRYDLKLPNSDALRGASGDVTGRAQVGMSLTADAAFADGLDATPTDYEAATTDIARLSNVLTTRSDSYTVYVLVQAWENFASPAARVVRQERVAFLVDRSGVYPSGNGLGLPGATGYQTPADALEALTITPLPVE